MQITPTSNFCVLVPNEIAKLGRGRFRAKGDLRGLMGREVCIAKKNSYLTLLPADGVEEGKEAALFSADDGCVVQLAIRLTK
jgi:hypothetical protein